MSAHLLCAYLNGIYFQLEVVDDQKADINYRKIIVNLFCLSHSPLKEQVYIFSSKYLKKLYRFVMLKNKN